MAEIRITDPLSLEEAVQAPTDYGSMTLAAFLLSAGIWHQRLNEDQSILPDEDLAPLGLSQWRLLDGGPRTRFAIRDPAIEGLAFGAPSTLDDYYHRLGDLILTAFKTRRSIDLARAVAMGTTSPDGLIRICALTSAFEIFRFSQHLVRKLTGFRFFERNSASELWSMLLSRIVNLTLGVVSPQQPSIQSHRPGASVAPIPSLMLIHGTNFPPYRPTWSVPGSGPLFSYIAGHRSDIYGLPDYYRWEGGYSDYAREVAAMNLDDWINRRALIGIDAVTHSYGGNVLMAATYLKSLFGKVLLLSCPVHWPKYQLRPGSIKSVVSVRVHLDYVILADRASQRFPSGSGIADKILPIYFDHSATTDPLVWKSYGIESLI